MCRRSRDEQGQCGVGYKSFLPMAEDDGIAQTAYHAYQQPWQTRLGLRDEFVVTFHVA